MSNPAPAQLPLALASQITALIFQRDPFDFHEAEKMTSKMLEETFVAHPEFEAHVLNLTRSTILLAAPGGGKTAGRRQFEQYLNRYRERVIDSGLEIP